MAKIYELAKSPDLIIELVSDESTTPDRVYVSSAAVANASAIWRRMIDPGNGFQALPTEDSSKGPVSVLTLADDDPGAMLTILRIMHYRGRDVKRSLDYEELCNIAKMCDKYDCAEVVYSWSDMWIESLRKTESTGSELAPGKEGWLLIAHVFRNVEGMERLTEELSAAIVMDCYDWESQTSGSLWRWRLDPHFIGDKTFPNYEGDIEVDTEIIPNIVLEHIWNSRKVMISQAQDLLSALYGDMQLGTDEAPIKGPQTSEVGSTLCDIPDCRSLATGSLIASLRTLGVPIHSPLQETAFRGFAVRAILNRLEAITCKTIVPWSYLYNLRAQSAAPVGLYNSRTGAAAPRYELPFGQSSSTYNVMMLVQICPSTDAPEALPFPQMSNGKPKRCGITNRMQKFNEDVKTLANAKLGFKFQS